MIRFNKDILIPVDFESPSVNAIQMAAQIAPFINGKVYLLNIVETGGIFADILETKSELVQHTEKALAKLDELKDKYLSAAGIETVIKVDAGKPHRKIIEYATSIDPSVILIGDNDQFIDGDKILGTTNSHIITHSKWPVITVKNRKPTKPLKIVLPLDLSHQSKSQLCNAIAMAKHYNSTIYLVSAVIGGIKVRDSRIYSTLRQIQKTIQQNGIKTEMKLYSRSEIPVYRRILEYATEIDADLIMIMTHTESATHDNYIGAVAHHVINEAPMPVLSLTYKAAYYEPEDAMSFVDPLNIFTDQKKVLKRKSTLGRLFGRK